MQEDGTAMLFSFLSLISIFKVDIAIVDVVIRIKSLKPFQVMKNTIFADAYGNYEGHPTLK